MVLTGKPSFNVSTDLHSTLPILGGVQTSSERPQMEGFLADTVNPGHINPLVTRNDRLLWIFDKPPAYNSWIMVPCKGMCKAGLTLLSKWQGATPECLLIYVHSHDAGPRLRQCFHAGKPNAGSSSCSMTPPRSKHEALAVAVSAYLLPYLHSMLRIAWHGALSPSLPACLLPYLHNMLRVAWHGALSPSLPACLLLYPSQQWSLPCKLSRLQAFQIQHRMP